MVFCECVHERQILRYKIAGSKSEWIKKLCGEFEWKMLLFYSFNLYFY